MIPLSTSLLSSTGKPPTKSLKSISLPPSPKEVLTSLFVGTQAHLHLQQVTTLMEIIQDTYSHKIHKLLGFFRSDMRGWRSLHEQMKHLENHLSQNSYPVKGQIYMYKLHITQLTQYIPTYKESHILSSLVPQSYKDDLQKGLLALRSIPETGDYLFQMQHVGDIKPLLQLFFDGYFTQHIKNYRGRLEQMKTIIHHHLTKRISFTPTSSESTFDEIIPHSLQLFENYVISLPSEKDVLNLFYTIAEAVYQCQQLEDLLQRHGQMSPGEKEQPALFEKLREQMNKYIVI